MRVIICGGGVDTPEDADTALAAALDALHARRRFTVVGLRAGRELVGTDTELGITPVVTPDPTDTLADAWTEHEGIDRILFPGTAQRGAYADHDRNRLMLTMLRPEMVVILPGGPDTTNLAHQARGMKIKVVEITPSPEHERGEDAAGADSAAHGQDGAQAQGGGTPPGGGAPPAPQRRPRGARAPRA